MCSEYRGCPESPLVWRPEEARNIPHIPRYAGSPQSTSTDATAANFPVGIFRDGIFLGNLGKGGTHLQICVAFHK